MGISTGGGRVEDRRGERDSRLGSLADDPALLVFHRDRPGVIAEVAALIRPQRINIAHMEVSRQEQGGEALMIVEVDQPVELATAGGLASSPSVEVTDGDCQLSSRRLAYLSGRTEHVP